MREVCPCRTVQLRGLDDSPAFLLVPLDYPAGKDPILSVVCRHESSLPGSQKSMPDRTPLGRADVRPLFSDVKRLIVVFVWRLPAGRIIRAGFMPSGHSHSMTYPFWSPAYVMGEPDAI